MDASEWLSAGKQALDGGDWAAARSAYEAALAQKETPEAVEGLGMACWWQDDQSAVLEARERAFRLYNERGDPRSAARVATVLALDYADFRGEYAVCDGWLQRAERLLRDVEVSPEHGWLRIYRGFEALMYRNQVEEALQRQAEAAAIGAQLDVLDIKMMAVALEGLILLRQGKVDQGMRRLDEAMIAAVGGEMSDLAAIGNTCCALIYACEAVADYDRAHQWCDRTREFCRRLGLDTFFAICRNYYAAVLIWKGEWDEAEAELSAAMRELKPARQTYLKESLAKLGELRRRQGRIEEAADFLRRAEPHNLSLMGQAALALDAGDPQTATDLLERLLRRLGVEDQAERTFALELLVRADILAGDLSQAERHLEELEPAANTLATQPLLATAAAARAALAQARGDLTAARGQIEDAIDLFVATGADFEAARLRLEYAAVLQALGRQAAALEQAIMAQTTFKRLGASLYAQRATDLIDQQSPALGAAPAAADLPYGLTAREAEVLWLIAAGKTNQDIARELVLSIRTVERHISTIYEKLELSGRSARASAAAIAVNLRAST